jgi:hypothetical protein
VEIILFSIRAQLRSSRDANAALRLHSRIAATR